MFYNLEDIKKDVRVAIDYNMVSDNIMEEADTLSLDDIIGSKILDAVRDIHLAAPAYMLEGHDFKDSTVIWEKSTGTGSGYVVLPKDFLKLVSFKMSDWERTVYAAVTPDDPKYALQRSRFGVKGNWQKPVCAITLRPELCMEFYSCHGGKNVTVEMAKYMSVPEISNEQVEICERCYKSVVYRIAGLTLVALNEPQKAEVLFTLSADLLK